MMVLLFLALVVARVVRVRVVGQVAVEVAVVVVHRLGLGRLHHVKRDGKALVASQVAEFRAKCILTFIPAPAPIATLASCISLLG